MHAADKDAIYMTLAYVIALCSKDERTKIGAIIIGQDGEVIATGYNGLPRGVDDDVPARQEKHQKYVWFEHAERNAIFNAARVGVSPKGGVLYTQGMPCAECARAVIQAGISRIIVHKAWNDQNSDNYGYAEAMTMFIESDVAVQEWDGNLIQPIGWRRGEVARATASDQRTKDTPE